MRFYQKEKKKKKKKPTRERSRLPLSDALLFFSNSYVVFFSAVHAVFGEGGIGISVFPLFPLIRKRHYTFYIVGSSNIVHYSLINFCWRKEKINYGSHYYPPLPSNSTGFSMLHRLAFLSTGNSIFLIHITFLLRQCSHWELT